MASIILELLQAEGRGTYIYGKLCSPDWAPELRERVWNRYTSAFSPAVSNPPPWHFFGRDDYAQKIPNATSSKALFGTDVGLRHLPFISGHGVWDTSTTDYQMEPTAPDEADEDNGDGYGYAFDGEGNGYDGEGNGYDGEGNGYDGEGNGYDGEGNGYDSEGNGYDSEGNAMLVGSVSVLTFWICC